MYLAECLPNVPSAWYIALAATLGARNLDSGAFPRISGLRSIFPFIYI